MSYEAMRDFMQQEGPPDLCPHGIPEDVKCPECIEDKYNRNLLDMEDELSILQSRLEEQEARCAMLEARVAEATSILTEFRTADEHHEAIEAFLSPSPDPGEMVLVNRNDLKTEVLAMEEIRMADKMAAGYDEGAHGRLVEALGGPK